MNNITIIGGGVSGTLLTINLIKNWTVKNGDITINLIELDRNKFNTGIAYSTQELSHLLNVRASGMSILPENSDHFFEWLKDNKYTYSKNDFVPRAIFGQYVKYYYEYYNKVKPSSITVNEIFGEVTNISKSGKYTLTLTDSKLETDIVVLAFGHLSISEIDTLKYKNINGYYRSPWSSDFLDKIKRSDDIFLIGSGLTSDDIILSLKERGHIGKISAISRKGHHPLVHKVYEPYPSFYDELIDKDINQIFSIVKKHIKSHNEPRAVVDSLRPNIQSIWKSLSQTDKSRFLRHVNQFWNVVRHRMPESTYETLTNMQDSGQLSFLRGDIKSVEQLGNKIKLVIYDKDKGEEVEHIVSFVINCIGPESNYKRINMSLIKNLLEAGVITTNDNSICIKTNNWNIIDSKNVEMNKLFAIGPVLKGELFESTAVPEIKIQATQLSKCILNSL